MNKYYLKVIYDNNTKNYFMVFTNNIKDFITRYKLLAEPEKIVKQRKRTPNINYISIYKLYNGRYLNVLNYNEPYIIM